MSVATSFDVLNTTTMSVTYPANGTMGKYIVRDVIYITAISVSSILAILGNGFVIKVISSHKRRSPIYLLIASMATSDLIAGASMLLDFFICSHYFFQNVSFGPKLCSASQAFRIATFFVSASTMASIAVERYHGLIVRPFGPPLPAKNFIIATWISGIVLNIPMLLGGSIPEYFTARGIISCRAIQNNVWDIRWLKIRAISFLLTQVLFPFGVTGFAYYRIAVLLKNSKKPGHSDMRSIQAREAMNNRTIKMMSVIIILFITAWSPVYLGFVLMLLSDESTIQNDCNNIPAAFYAVFWLAMSTCCFNPFVYIWYYKEFMGPIKNSWRTIISRQDTASSSLQPSTPPISQNPEAVA